MSSVGGDRLGMWYIGERGERFFEHESRHRALRRPHKVGSRNVEMSGGGFVLSCRWRCSRGYMRWGLILRSASEELQNQFFVRLGTAFVC